MKGCEYFENLMVDRHPNHFSPGDKAALKTHLLTCQNCRNIFSVNGAFTLSMNSLASDAPFPPALPDKIMSKISGLPNPGGTPPPPSIFSSSLLPHLTIAALVTLIGFYIVVAQTNKAVIKPKKTIIQSRSSSTDRRKEKTDPKRIAPVPPKKALEPAIASFSRNDIIRGEEDD